jgi:DNA processing protein
VHIAGLEGIGSSIAVLGSGIDVPYPPANRDLYLLMQEKGLLLSEFMPGTVPFAGNFPVRNRIISGLAKAVLVIEAALRSGTLSTARHATEQNRDVFAVPGSALASTSEGCRELIRRGAKPVFAAEDILLELLPMLKPEIENKIKENKYLAGQALSTDTAATLAWANDNKKRSRNIQGPKLLAASAAQVKKTLLPDEPEQLKIVKLLEQTDSCHIEDLAIKLNLPISKLSGILAMLEIKGLVKRLPGTFYSAVLRV